MNIKTFAKKVLSSITKGFRGGYRFFYAKPLVLYKKRKCAAVNEFRVYKKFSYSPDSYYPAILQCGPNQAQKIYKRIVEFDRNGLPMVKGFKQKYWPVTITQFGLLNYNFYLTYKQDEYRQFVLGVCTWLKENITDNGLWAHEITYHSSVVEEDIEPPYGSAMVQGEGISVLVRGYFLSGNTEYLDCAQKALDPFFRSPEKQGVLDYFYGLPFFEEYPTRTPSLVLNGFLFSLFGLYDLSKMNHRSAIKAGRLFDDGYKTLLALLPMYDGGFCSRYDLSHITAAPHNNNKNPFYHSIHVNQLIAMNSIRRSAVLEYYIKEWR